MRGPSPVPVVLSPRVQSLLQRLRSRQTACQRLVRRVSILLTLAADPCIEAAAKLLRLTRLTVRQWRDRWLEAATELDKAEGRLRCDQQLSSFIQEILDDIPRPGVPATFGPEQIVGIVAVACELPEKSGRPISHWTSRELADEVVKRRIVPRISPRSVGRFLKGGRSPAS
jgi:putative transposase